MKKYIGLTIYFIGLVGLSYTFFYLSGNKGINTKKDNKVVSGDKIPNNIINDNKKKKETGKIEDKIQNIEKIKDNKVVSGEKIQKIPNNIINDNKKKKEKDIPLENIYIGLGHGTLIKDSKYEDIYSILGLSKLPLYKIEDKDIYIKKLKSIEYEDEKNNITKLIQKIGGNVIETNLFGNKQLFVNIDVYYKKQSIILVLYDGKTYLLVLPYKKYQDYKSYLKEVLFVN